MSSWFNVAAIKNITGNLTENLTDMADMETIKGLTEKVQKAADMETIKGLTEKVQKAVPSIDKDLLEKLTLTSPDLVAEHDKIDEEEKRKERVKESLSGMLPWETKDKERDILVEECKDAILLLSTKKETFYGPYHMPVKGDPEEEDSTTTTVELQEGISENKERVTEDEIVAKQRQENETQQGDSNSRHPSKEALEKLAKLEPLPPLLADFDLDTHVGLIKRLLKEDPKLVQMQSSLSGGGSREKIFWRNYFFHCAFTRYEAGMSIDEIWSDQQPSSPPDQTQESESSDPKTNSVGPSASNEETITFESSKVTDSDTAKDTSGFQLSELDLVTPTTADAPAVADSTTTGSSPGDDVADSNDFELVAASDDGRASDLLAVGGEMDELEAEILRELED